MNTGRVNLKAHVLVVEDDRSVRRMLRFSLTDSGFEVDEVDNGVGAIQKLESNTPDAVIVDLGLADGRGANVLDWLHHRADAGEGRPVWVVVSALDQDEAMKRYGSLGPHFIAKPFDPWKLVELIENLLEKRLRG
ncbi:MAG: response regulator [Chloroflexi bacterium]|nr:response regulator [Chloroflexota bacterium]MDA1219642.1 response regulator [Chloroflexota bacterium]